MEEKQLQRGSEIEKHLKSGLFDSRISNGLVCKWSGFSYGDSPNHLKTGPFKIWTFLSEFQMDFDKIAVTCPDFNGLTSSFQIPLGI